MAIEDADNSNGCMWGVPKSHNEKTSKFFIRKTDDSGTEHIDDGGKKLGKEGAVILEAKKGNFLTLL